MERRKLDSIFTYFQARARGYLVRKEVRRAREDFEDIVREIDGGSTHLLWKSTVIPIPHFTDTDGPLSGPSSEAVTAAALTSHDHQPHLTEKTGAERDKTQIKGHSCPSSTKDGGVDSLGPRNKGGNKDREALDSVGDSTTIWSSFEQDVNHSFSQQGPWRYCLAQEVPRTPEALRLHRNTLTMELVWLQQAIDSRKKYLSLRSKLVEP